MHTHARLALNKQLVGVAEAFEGGGGCGEEMLERAVGDHREIRAFVHDHDGL